MEFVVAGQGYVGLPRAVGHRVVGYDVGIGMTIAFNLLARRVLDPRNRRLSSGRSCP